MQLRLEPIVRASLLVLAAWFAIGPWTLGDDVHAAASAPKQAGFAITNTFTVNIPANAQHMRIWFAVPQDDAASEIRDLAVEASYPVRYGTDSHGNYD